MNALSLFSGAEGGLLATKHLLDWKTIGYVEINDYCQRIIAQRIRDGVLDNAPIFTDIKAFINSGCCDFYKGITDIITAGFPCQPFSSMGKGQAENDDRNMWSETKDVIQEINPAFVFLENIPNLLRFEYSIEIIQSLFKIGFEVLPEEFELIAFKKYAMSEFGKRIRRPQV